MRENNSKRDLSESQIARIVGCILAVLFLLCIFSAPILYYYENRVNEGYITEMWVSPGYTSMMMSGDIPIFYDVPTSYYVTVTKDGKSSTHSVSYGDYTRLSISQYVTFE